jgi:hypothetical protein
VIHLPFWLMKLVEKMRKGFNDVQPNIWSIPIVDDGFAK